MKGSLLRRLLGALLILLSPGLAWAMSPESLVPTTADLAAVSKAIGFVEGQARSGELRIGILHLPTEAARNEAGRAAELLAATSGPASTVLVPVLIPSDAQELDQSLSAIFVMPGAASAAAGGLAGGSAKRMLTISSSADCLANRGCMLMVKAEPRVTIVLDTAAAEAAAIRFSPIFIMMVKRR